MRESALGTWFRDSLRKPFKRTALFAFLICVILLSVCAPAKAQSRPGLLQSACVAKRNFAVQLLPPVWCKHTYT